MSILKKFYTFEILDDKYMYYYFFVLRYIKFLKFINKRFSASHTYFVPPVGNIDSYLEYIS